MTPPDAAPPVTRGRPDPESAPARTPARTPASRLQVAGVVLLLVALTVLAWFLYQRWGAPDARGGVRSFQVLSDRAVVVEFEVTTADRQEAYCLVRARDASGAETGREVVRVPAPPPGERTVVHRHELATAARAVTGEVRGCSLSPPAATPAP